MKKIKIFFIGFWNDFDPEDNFIINTLRKKYLIEINSEPDFLFYSSFSADHLYFTKCVKIFYTYEAITPDFNECDFAIGFDYISFDNRYMRVDRTVDYNKEQKDLLPFTMAQRKFCNFIYFNLDSGHGTSIRQDFCKKLMQYKHVDCPGRVLNNMQNAIGSRFAKWEDSKLDFIKDYKFTIAFENCSKNGYTTEKIMHPLQSNSIPIYWGDPMITREFNSKAFINCHDFQNFNQVIEYIKYIDNDENAYMSMLKEAPMREDYIQDADKLENFLNAIIENGSNVFAKDPRNNWDTKKEIIKKLLEENCYHNAQMGNIPKVEEYCHLALCLDENLNWPNKQLAKVYRKFQAQQRIANLPAWHKQKILSNATLAKMLAEELYQTNQHQQCIDILLQVINQHSYAEWAKIMLRQLSNNI